MKIPFLRRQAIYKDADSGAVTAGIRRQKELEGLVKLF
jgi:hypothetical protein